MLILTCFESTSIRDSIINFLRPKASKNISVASSCFDHFRLLRRLWILFCCGARDWMLMPPDIVNDSVALDGRRQHELRALDGRSGLLLSHRRKKRQFQWTLRAQNCELRFKASPKRVENDSIKFSFFFWSPTNLRAKQKVHSGRQHCIMQSNSGYSKKKMFLRWQFLKSKPGVHLPCAMQKDPLTMLCNDMKCAREHKALNAKRTPNGNFSFISQFRVHRNCQKADLMIVKHEKEKKRLQKRYPAERKFHVGFYAKRRKGKERRKSRGKKRMKNAKCIIKCSTENY